MTYCTIAEVRAAIDFPDSGAPINDDDILEFIKQSEEEIEGIYKTKFGSVEAEGTADGSYSTTGFADSTAKWTTDEYIGYVVKITGGTGSGQYRSITDNTNTALTVTPAFDTTPDGTSTYEILKLGYKDETRDGTGHDTMFVIEQPLLNLIELSINSTDITPSYVYQYNDSGKLVLGNSAEASYFSNTYPQLVQIKYIYGVASVPRQIKRLCILLSAMRTMTAQIAGTYDDFSSISLPGGLNASKGEPYVNIQSAINYMQGEARGIIYGFSGDQVTADFRGVPSYRPFSNFA